VRQKIKRPSPGGDAISAFDAPVAPRTPPRLHHLFVDSRPVVMGQERRP
jgi:hypothetical protein